MNHSRLTQLNKIQKVIPPLKRSVGYIWIGSVICLFNNWLIAKKIKNIYVYQDIFQKYANGILCCSFLFSYRT